MAGWSKVVVYTVGHSTRPIEAFLDLLDSFEVEILADIRTIPRSRRNPWFNQDALPASLAARGIGYAHVRALGGLRHTKKDSVNTGWRNESFRGYADYMQTSQFAEGLSELQALASQGQVAIMCAEAVPWRCHRSLVADALLVRGAIPLHIMGVGRAQAHRLTSFAQVDGTSLTYPPEDLTAHIPP